MTDTADPHSEYRRQAAAHFGQPAPPPSPQPPPDSTARLLNESSQRFAAGTTYGASGRAQPPPVTPPAAPTPPPATGHFGAPPAAANASVPPPQWTSTPTPPTYTGAAGAPNSGLNLQPSHALWILAGLSLLCVYLSGFGWLLVAAGCAGGAWYAQTKGTAWPPDVEDVLVLARLTRPSSGASPANPTSTPFGGPGGQPAPAVAFIPFRPLTISELFGGAFRVMRKNWPTLVGIPVTILLAFLVVLMIVGYVAMQFMSSAMTTSLAAGMSPGGMMAALITMMLIGTVLMYVIALPADALLIALTVISTDKAVRGEPVRLVDVFRLARGRMFAVCRLTLAYYALFVVVDLLYSGVVFLAIGQGMSALLLGIPIFLGCLVIGILTSLSPIVLVMEGHGVADSLRRSMQLAKPAFSRLLLIHFLWGVGVTAILVVPAMIVTFALGFLGMMLFLTLSFGVLIAFFRTLQMLIYTDLRMRQENYEQELIADWARNTTY